MTNYQIRLAVKKASENIKDYWNYRVYVKYGINREEQMKVANQIRCIYRKQKEPFVIEKMDAVPRGRKRMNVSREKTKDIEDIIVDGIRGCKTKKERIEKIIKAKAMLYSSELGQIEKDYIWIKVWNRLL